MFHCLVVIDNGLNNWLYDTPHDYSTFINGPNAPWTYDQSFCTITKTSCFWKRIGRRQVPSPTLCMELGPYFCTLTLQNMHVRQAPAMIRSPLVQGRKGIRHALHHISYQCGYEKFHSQPSQFRIGKNTKYELNHQGTIHAIQASYRGFTTGTWGPITDAGLDTC